MLSLSRCASNCSATARIGWHLEMTPTLFSVAFLTRYDRFEVSFAPNDPLTGRDYRLTVVAQVTARERSSGKTSSIRRLPAAR